MVVGTWPFGSTRKGGLMGNRWFGFAIVTLYLVEFGVFAGTLIERIRFDESRSVLLKQLDEDRSKLQRRLMAIERGTTVERKGIRNDFSID
jgi:hypothetical protein